MPLNCPDFDGHQVALKVVLVVQVVNAGAQHLESAFSVLVLLEAVANRLATVQNTSWGHFLAEGFCEVFQINEDPLHPKT
jgi:hypothetical protein